MAFSRSTSRLLVKTLFCSALPGCWLAIRAPFSLAFTCRRTENPALLFFSLYSSREKNHHANVVVVAQMFTALTF